VPSAPFPCLLAGLIFTTLAVSTGGQAHAQALGSVHCKASLRNIGIDLKATERKLSSVQNGSVEQKCSAMNVHVHTLERAREVFGRCLEASGRDGNVGQADASAADLRDQIAKTCG
jgi:hypothetical protein